MPKSNKKLKNQGYPPEWTDEFKRYIRQRDNYLCAICDSSGRMDVHHIDYVKLHTTRENCISLCRTCHDKVHNASWTRKHELKIMLWAIAARREKERAANIERTRQITGNSLRAPGTAGGQFKAAEIFKSKK